MKLFTENKDKSWNRIVYLYVNKDDDLKSWINDKENCKLIIIKRGNGLAQINKKIYVLTTSTIIVLRPDCEFLLKRNDKLNAQVLYFKPQVVNDNLTHQKLLSACINNKDLIGSTLYQDIMLLNIYYNEEKDFSPVFTSLPSSHIKIQSLFDKIYDELNNQTDTFWPCRSRSFFIELLFFINSSLKHADKGFSDDKNKAAEIIEYLNENISEKIVLDDILKKFLINRNELNKIFHDACNTTCIEYLLHLRMDLSILLLKGTDLPVSEIAERTGYNDASYFIKAFKKYTKMTPAQFRSNISL